MGINKNFNIFISHAWKKDEEFERVLKFLNASEHFKYTNFGCPFEDAQEVHKHTEEELSKTLEDQIVQSQIVIIASGMYSAHSKWIQKEIDIAKKFNRPIIVIKPWGNKFTPMAVTNITRELLDWDTASILEAIRKNCR